MEIAIPANAIVILIGPAGAGKTTFARTYFSATQVVSSAGCRGLVAGDPYSRYAEVRANRLLRLIVSLRLSVQKLTVADATNIRAFPRGSLQQLGRAYGAPVVGIVFDIPIATCLRRNALRPHHEPEDVIRRQWRELQAILDQLRNEPFHSLHMLTPEDQDSASLLVTSSQGMPIIQ